MERRFKTLLALAWAFSIVCSLYAGYALAPLFRHGTTKGTANVYVAWEHAGGVDYISIGNVITDIGEQYIRDKLANGGTLTAIKYISIGNATASASLTDLASEHDRQAGDVVAWVNSGDYAFNVTYKWVNVGPVTLNAAGLHWDASAASTLFAVANFAQTSFGSNDNLTIRWVITVDAN